MKLTKRIEYALVGLYYLAYVRPHHFVQVRTVAEEVDLPKRFLEQIFLVMREHGILESKRGARGGYRLALPLQEVTLGLLCGILEENPRPPRPPLRGIGVDRFVWNAYEALWAALDRITLEDLFTEDLRNFLRTGATEAPIYYI